MDLRNMPGSRVYAILVASAVALAGPNALSADVTRGLERLRYNHPGLVVDLGVGLWAWPLPMDFEGDGRRLAGHTTSPTVVDWDGDGLPDLVVGGEDGFLYYLKNPHAKTTTPNGNAGQDK